MNVDDILNSISDLVEKIENGEKIADVRISGMHAATEKEELLKSKPGSLVISPAELFNSPDVLPFLKTLMEEKKVSFLILTGSCDLKRIGISRLCKTYKIPLILTKKDVSMAFVINKLSDYMSRQIQKMEDVRNCYLELVRLSTVDCGVPRLLKQAVEILGNPLVVTDESYKLVGYASLREVNDPIWERIIKNGYCPMDIVKKLRNEGFERQLEKEASPQFLTKGEFSKYIRRMVAEIRIGQQLKGYMALLEYEKPITHLDGEVLKYISSIIALEFAKTDAIARARGHLGRELLADLVKGNIGSEAIAQNRIQSLDWRLGKFHQVMVVGHIKQRRIGGEFLDPLQSLILRHIPNAKMNFTSKHIVILLSGNSKHIIDKVMPDIERFCKQHDLCVGIGRIYKTLLEVSLSFKEAKKAIRLAAILNLPSRVYYYEDLAVYDILEQVSKDSWIHPGLLALVEYDRQEGTDYVNTLFTYLQTGKSLNLTAKKLFLHRNTVLYRIKKIEEILQCKLDNHSFCLQLELGILMLKMNAKQDFL